MDKKNLAKGVLAALLLTGSAVNAVSFNNSQEATTFLAVAGCRGYNTAPPQGDYQSSGYTADDSNNPYARPGNPQGSMGGGYGYSSDRQSNNPSYSSSDWQSSPYGTDGRMGGGNPQGTTYGSDRTGAYNSTRNPSDPYNNMGGGTNSTNASNPQSTNWDNRR